MADIPAAGAADLSIYPPDSSYLPRHLVARNGSSQKPIESYHNPFVLNRRFYPCDCLPVVPSWFSSRWIPAIHCQAWQHNFDPALAQSCQRQVLEMWIACSAEGTNFHRKSPGLKEQPLRVKWCVEPPLFIATWGLNEQPLMWGTTILGWFFLRKMLVQSTSMLVQPRVVIC